MTTAPPSAWPSAYPARSGAAPEKRLTALDMFIDACAVLVILTYSQGWIAPIWGDSMDASAGGIIRLMYFPGYFAGLAILAVSAGDTIRVLLRQPFMVGMLVLSVASMAWSIDPSETIRRIVALAFTTAGGVALAARYSWKRLAEVLAIAFAIQCVLSFALGLAVPRIGRMPAGSEFPGAWRGLWAEKNSMGDNMALYMPAFIASAIFHPKRRLLWIGMAVLAAALLLLSTSKTSLMAMILALGAAVFIALVRKSPSIAVTMTYLAVLVVACAVSAVVLATDQIFGLLGKDATLTGRTEIWAAIMTQVANHPWLGHGYGTVWTDESPWAPLAQIIKQAHFRPHHAHSSWYEQLIWLGWTGFFLWAFTLGQTLLTGIVAAFRDKGAYLALPFLVVYSLISLTESITLTYNDLRWVLFVAIACKVAYPDRARMRP